MLEPRVSVVLPLFGDHRATQVLPRVCRAWLAQDVPCEIVIGVGPDTEVPDLPDDRIRLVFADQGPSAAGPLRNLAAAAARGSTFYLGDADIVPLGTDYLTRALELGRDRVVIQPWLYRLVDRSGTRDDLVLENPRFGRVCHVDAGPDGRLQPVGPERFLWQGRDCMIVEPPPGVGWNVREGSPWFPPPYHWGGFLVERKLFDDVGGYCTIYSGWGCEDDDLIAKLEGRIEVMRAWRAARGLACLHFEHSRTHTVTLPANQEILARRLDRGVDAMIAEDR
ncbi:galactosyltransferase-related protein [Catellatospora bangladeshensis]|uniref:galactosyltransferase-related protein n=2 Tax=Catellatospora bangladeshensis TaxID=310355 RepID=UPI00194597A1|nr:galactosyltransferase-related protein [Catellatospora bangladeshensis]